MRSKLTHWFMTYGAGNFHVLLGFLLVAIFLQGFAATNDFVHYASRAGVLVVIFAAVRVIASSTTTRATGRGLLAFWFLTQIPSWIWGAGLTGAEELFVDQLAEFADVLAFAWILVTLVLVLIRSRRVGAQEISASLCAYLMLGMWFFAVYTLLGEDEFLPPAETVEPLTRNNKRGDLFYYSFVTLTSLGYGDVTPVTPLARSISIVEVVLGQFYLAVLIARQVGLYLVQRGAGDDGDPVA